MQTLLAHMPKVQPSATLLLFMLSSWATSWSKSLPLSNLNKRRPGSCSQLCLKPPRAHELQLVLTLKQGLAFQETIKRPVSQSLHDTRQHTESALVVPFSDGSTAVSKAYVNWSYFNSTMMFFCPSAVWPHVFWNMPTWVNILNGYCFKFLSPLSSIDFPSPFLQWSFRNVWHN